jgi:hypothetical protein
MNRVGYPPPRRRKQPSKDDASAACRQTTNLTRAIRPLLPASEYSHRMTHPPRFPRILLAGLVAPFIAPALSIVAAWAVVESNRAELARWIQLSDLWPLHLWLLGIAQAVTWCVGYPVFARARARHAESGRGMCIVGRIIGALVFSLPVALLSLSMSWDVLIGFVFGVVIGMIVAALFSLLAGIPWTTRHSMLLQRDP